MRDDLTEYEKGYLNGLWAYGWWKDGTCYVGTTGRTYKEAAERFMHSNGHEGWEVRFTAANGTARSRDAEPPDPLPSPEPPLV